MKRLTVTVRGMSCPGCEQRISNALGRLDGVGGVTSDHESGRVAVDYDPAVVGEEAITDWLAEAGYDTVDAGSRS